MQLPGSRGQQVRDFFYRADGSVTGAGSPVLILPERKSCSFLFIQNISNGGMYLEFGNARATATLTNGVVTSVAVANGGFGYTKPPSIEAFGGGNGGNTAFIGAGLIGYHSPNSPASLQAVLTNGVVTSVNILSGGSGYLTPPYLHFRNSILDPKGCADPSLNSGTGAFLGSAQNWASNGTTCTTDPVAIYGSGTGTQDFTCIWMP